MPYLDDFEYDIFISYAHVDNLAAPGKPSWIEEFHKELEIALAKRIGKVGLVKIWRDKKIEGDQLFDETISEGISKSAIFLALTSNGYMTSEYCKKELEQFHQKAIQESFGLKIGDRSRIYNVLLNKIPHEEWPSQFGRITGHEFYYAEDDDDNGEPTERTNADFNKQLKKLVKSLYNILTEFKKSTDIVGPGGDGKELKPGQQTIFLAEVSDPLQSIQKRLINELERENVKIITGVPPPYSSEEHEDKVASIIENVDLSVHLLDQFRGRKIEGEEASYYGEKQVRIVQNINCPQLIWVPKNLDYKKIEDEERKVFLNELENGKRENDKFDFIRGSHTSLSTQVLEKLTQLKSIEPPQFSSETLNSVLLDTHIKDQMLAFDLGRTLLENNIKPFINPQEDNPSTNIDVLKDRLKQVSMLAILYGSVNEKWVLERLGLAVQLSIVNKLNIKSFYVLSVPPKKRNNLDLDYRHLNVNYFDYSNTTQLDSSVLKSFLTSVKGGES